MTEPGGGARTSLLSVAWKVVAALALFGALVIGVGIALPGTWTAERAVVIEAPPDSVFRWLETPALWARWTALGSVETTPTGPERGTGAALTWDDPWVGDGRFVILDSRAPRTLRYRVEVEGGTMTTEGNFSLEALEDGRTRVTWAETGDFGWNPLMGYAALNMDRIQGTELERGLTRLRALAKTGTLPDSLRLDPPAATPAPSAPASGA